MKNNRFLPSVTVAICAFNEEANIANVIRSVLKQTQVGFVINNIWVYSDGSSDKTVSIAKTFNHKRVSVYSKSKRLGKSYRLDTIYRRLESDILIQVDADVVLAHNKVFFHLLKPLIENKSIHLTCGNTQPLKPITFTEKSIHFTYQLYEKLKMEKRNGSNIYSVSGKILAITNKLAKETVIPVASSANDAYVYFSCITKGYTYKYVRKAKVFYRLPQTLVDHIKQNIRFLRAQILLKGYFPKEIVKCEYTLYHKAFLRTLLIKSSFSHPILSSYIFILNMYCRIQSRLQDQNNFALWPISPTTKQLIKSI